MAKLIDGKAISQAIRDEVRDEIAASGIKATLAVVLVGDDPASAVYVRNKKLACEYCGIRSVSYELPADTTEEKLLSLIDELNNDPEINGILVQLPVPDGIDEDKVIETISPMKDVDGFSRASVGALSIGAEGFVSCTPAGIIELLKRSDIEIDGKNCVVIGRSNIVGKPAAMLLLRENGTVTIAHSHTKDLAEVAKKADILVVAIGKPEFITADYVKEGAAVIDVGIHRLDPEKNGGKKLCGDVKFDEVEPVAGAITPVPGGVGPMTIAMLMKNTVAAYKMQH
ncbi:methylenetetrahydrofolate dehydrogenase (NADP+) / methenyltetrahydrofolate cyclohydrolase [Lachnospiraceae bacterium]|nr:methylenetetrahydrofolate dehydrogenase (NADP+) / methenyltetrahydrofolate cyclohydrolase [Lachnospiraceae bacterium]